MLVKKFNNFLSKLRNRHFLMMDIILLSITPYLSLLLRYDWNFHLVSIDDSLVLMFAFFLIIKLIIIKYLGLYRRYWKSATIDDLAVLLLVGLFVGLVQLFIFSLLRKLSIYNISNFPLSFPFIDTMFTLFFLSAPRFSIRLFERVEQRLNSFNYNEIRTLIVGAGFAGVSTLVELQRNRDLKLYPVGFIDDDPSKKNLRIRGVSVFGNRTLIKKIVTDYKVQRILIAMPSVNGGIIREILTLAQNTKAEVFTLPGLSEIIGGRVSIEKFRKIKIDDLLRREPFQTNLEQIHCLMAEKVVLITGAGGSIGKEISRQVSQANPKLLLLLGHGENSIFEIEQELKLTFPHLLNRIVPLIADVRDTSRIGRLISLYKPDIIFHAAAHKHVPMMETNLVEAITNNIFGLKNLLNSASKYHVKDFVYISTDKAVDPRNIMGASKRVAELLIMKYSKTIKTRLITVRFGNVLGSRGSVVQTFQKQILSGGPITVTEPEIARYFMTIPEAVQLVMQAFGMGRGGEIFVLDMGNRIKIVDLAKDMIRLSGYDEDQINIKFTGLRLGEKMIEELHHSFETINETSHKKIYSVTADYSNVFESISMVDELIDLAMNHKEAEAKELLFRIVKFVK